MGSSCCTSAAGAASVRANMALVAVAAAHLKPMTGRQDCRRLIHNVPSLKISPFSPNSNINISELLECYDSLHPHEVNHPSVSDQIHHPDLSSS